MRTITTLMMAIIMIMMPTQLVAQEMRNLPTLSACPQNSGNALTCMACAVYYESKSEPHQGQVAVAAVVMNRVGSNQFPSTVCKVVYQPHQFSWATSAKYRSRERNARLWSNSLAVAKSVLAGDYTDPSGGALYFHNNRERPGFAKTKKVVAVIGNHIFRR